MRVQSQSSLVLALLMILAPFSAGDSQSGSVLSAVSGHVRLGSGQVVVSLPGVGAELLESRLAHMTSGRRLFLVLRGFSAKAEPGVFYSVYIDLPPGAKPGKDDPHYVGRINFYDAAGRSEDQARAFETTAFLSYDITSIVRNLRARKLLDAKTTVTIRPLGEPMPGAEPVINRIELVEE